MNREIKEGKIKINGSEHSERVQEELFSKGYKWQSQIHREGGGSFIDYGDAYILFESDKTMSKIDVYEVEEGLCNYYEEDYREEVTLKDIINYVK